MFIMSIFCCYYFHVCPLVRPCVPVLQLKLRYNFFLVSCMNLGIHKTQICDVSDFWRKFSFLIFLAKIWPFLAKNALFGPFLPNATINFPDFCYRNLFSGLLKMAEKKFRGKILVFDFLDVFGQNFVVFDQKCSFWPISPKRYYKCS